MDSLQDSMRAASVYPKPASRRGMTPRPVAICAADIMTTDLLILPRATTVPEAIRALLKKGVTGAPVVDETGKLVGIISELDCMKILATTAFHQEAVLRASTVESLMTKDVHTVSREVDLYAIVHKFMQYRIRRLPVLNRGKVVGMVSRRDVLGAMQDLLG